MMWVGKYVGVSCAKTLVLSEAETAQQWRLLQGHHVRDASSFGVVEWQVKVKAVLDLTGRKW